MRKYWIPIVISIVMIASIGTFYIQSVFATNHKPMLSIEKIDGDEKEVESLLLTGFYYDELNFLGEEFEISSEGTKYLEDSSFFERIEGVYGSHHIRQLQKDYRHFMRGKYADVNSYFENEDFLAYADISYKNPYTVSSEFQFSIAVLDKRTNTTISFEHLVPNSGDFWYLHSLKVQVIDDQLKLITQHDMREDNRKEIHLYTFDLTEKTLLNDEVILSTENEIDEYTDMRTLGEDDPTSESVHLVLLKTDRKQDVDGFLEEVVNEELIIYDLTLNTLEMINLEKLSGYGYPEYVDGSHVYFMNNGESGTLKMATYDLGSKQIVQNFDVDSPNDEVGWSSGFNEGKLYLVDSQIDFEKSAHVTVIHLEDGKTLFKGEVKPKDQKEIAEGTEVGIYHLLFK